MNKDPSQKNMIGTKFTLIIIYYFIFYVILSKMEVCDLLIYTITDAILKSNYNKLDEIIKTDENLLIVADGKYDFSCNYINSLTLKEIYSIVQKLFLTTKAKEYKYILKCCERDLVRENRMLRREIAKLRSG